MASRPLYAPSDKFPFVIEKTIEFKWHAGLSVSQKQKSINALHAEITGQGFGLKPLEVSSKSELDLGVALSAFNLLVSTENGNRVAVENIFQAAKIFKQGGPYKDLLQVSPLDAKRDIRLKESGDLTGFQGREYVWPLEPKTIFYDWIYINALYRDIPLANKIMDYDSFTDIEFNPKKSFNCQARSVALFVALRRTQQLAEIIGDPVSYRKLMLSDLDKFPSQYKIPVQQSLI